MLSYKNIVLIFSLVKTAFLSSYNNIVLSFRQIGTTFLSSYKNFFVIFSLIRTIIVNSFCFSIYKIIDSEYSTDDYKSPKIIIGAIIINPEKLKFAPDRLKSKKNCKQAVKKCLL